MAAPWVVGAPCTHCQALDRYQCVRAAYTRLQVTLQGGWGTVRNTVLLIPGLHCVLHLKLVWCCGAAPVENEPQQAVMHCSDAHKSGRNVLQLIFTGSVGSFRL